MEAATLYWDVSDATSNTLATGLGLGGTGDWNTSTAAWWNGSALVLQPWDNNGVVDGTPDTAVFWGTAGPITMTESINVGGLGFYTPGYALNLGANTLSFTGTNNLITLLGGGTSTITGQLGGAGNVVLQGSRLYGSQILGTLTLNGTSTTGWTGTTTINAGMTLSLAGANRALAGTTGMTLNGGGLTLTNINNTEAAYDRVATVPITANGGTITYTNTAVTSAAYNEVLGTLALTTGRLGIVSTNAMTSGTQTLTFGAGSLTHPAANSSALMFAGASLGTNAFNRIIITGETATPVGQIIGPWATWGATLAQQTDYASYNRTAGGAENTNGIQAAAITATTQTAWTDALQTYSFSATQLLTATRTVTAVRRTGGNLTLDSNFNFQTYGLLNGGTTAWTVGQGTGTGFISTPAGGGNLYVTPGRAGITISAPINNNSGTVTLIVSGSNALTLSSTTSNFSGGVILNGGVTPTLGATSTAALSVVANTNLGGTSGGITFNGSATMNITDAITIGSGRTITTNSGATAKFGVGADSVTLAGKITGSGGLILEATSGDRTFTLSNTTSDFQGPLAVGYTSNQVTALVASLADSPIADGAIRLGGSASGGRGVFQWNGAASLVLNNRRIDLWGVLGSFGVIDNSRADSVNTITINTPLAVSAAGAKTLILQGSNTGANAFAGQIADGLGAVISVSKQGTGNWLLTGENTFTGSVFAEGGTLTVAGPQYKLSQAVLRGGRLVLSAQNGLLNDAAVLSSTVAGGTYLYDGTGATGFKAQNFASLSLTGGDIRLESLLGSATSLATTFNAPIARGLGSTANFVVTGGVNGSTNRFVAVGQATGFMGPGLFFGGNRYAWYDVAGFIRAIDYATDVGALSFGAGSSITAPAGTQVRTTGSISAQLSASIGTLHIDGPYDFTLASGETLTLDGILKSGGGASAIGGGAGLQIGVGTELIVRTDLATDTLSITSPLLNAARITKTGDGALNALISTTYANFTNVDIAAGLLNLDFGTETGTFTAAASLTAAGNATLRYTTAGAVTHSGVVSGVGSVTKAGLGTLELTGVNTFSGQVNVVGGTLIVSDLTQLGNAFNDIFLDNGGILRATTINNVLGVFNNTATGRQIIIGPGGGMLDIRVLQAFNGGVSGGGTLTKMGDGIMAVGSAENPFTGQIIVQQGILRMNSSQWDNAAGIRVLSGATFNIEDDAAGTFSIAVGAKYEFAGNGFNDGGAFLQSEQTANPTFTSTINNEVVLNSPAARFTLAVPGGTVRVTSQVTGSGGLDKWGPGTLHLINANNTFAGGLTLTSGNLIIYSQGTSSVGSSIGTGPLTLQGGVLSIAGANPLDLSTTTNNALVINGDFTLGGTNALNLGTGAANLGAAAGTTRTITLSGPSLTIGGAIADGTTANSLTKTGPGTLTLTGDSTITGTLANMQSIMQIGTGGATGSFNGALEIVNNGTLIVDRGSGTILLPNLVGIGDIYVRGAGVKSLIGENSNSGLFVVDGGTLRLDYSTVNLTKLNDFQTLTIGRSILELVGGSHSEIVASVSLTGDLLARRPSGGAVLYMNTVTPNGFALNFEGSGIARVDNLNNTAGILGSWATVTVGGLTSWAVNEANANDGLVVPLTDYDVVERLGSGSNGALLSGVRHVRIIDGGVAGPIQMGALTVFIPSLTMSAADGPAVLAVGSSTINFGDDTGGAVLIGQGAGNLTIGDAPGVGTITAGGTANMLPARIDFNVYDAAQDLLVNSVIANNGTDVVGITKYGAGRLILNTSNAFSGGAIVSGGVLRLTNAGALGTSTAADALRVLGGTVQLANSNSTNFLRNTTVAGNAEFVIDGIGGGAVTHTLGLLSIGAQTLTVSSMNAVSGPQGLTFGNVTTTAAATFVSNSVGGVDTLLALPQIAVGSGFALNFGGTGNINVTAAVSGTTGGIFKAGSGTLTLSGTNTFVGNTTITAGVLSLSGTTGLGNAANDVFIDNNAVLRITTSGGLGTVSNTVTARQITVGSGGAQFDFRADQTFAGGLSGSGTVTKTGAGVWSVGTSSNPFTGQLVISAGELRMASVQFAAAAGMTINSGATFTINDNGNASWNLATGAIYQFSGTGASAGFGALRQTQQSGTNAFTSTFVREVRFNTPGTLIVTNTPTGTIAFTGPVSGAGGIEKAGTGTLSIASTATYAGDTTVTAGRFVVVGPNGSVGATTTVSINGTLAGSGKVANLTVNGGTIAPGVTGAGKLTADGASVVWNNGTRFQFEFSNPTGDISLAGTNWDLLDITAGTLALSGTITVRVDAWNSGNTTHATLPTDNAFDPSSTYQWLFARAAGGIMGYGDSTFVIDATTSGFGVFGTGNAYLPVAGQGFWVSQAGNELYLNYSAVPEPSGLTLVGLIATTFAARRRRRQHAANVVQAAA
ncbi:MAG: autotransporter-associated beta strand repeat-containing protein [Planctomycetales bacterium]|nr:autotransporter-associated beta strand repeat-containing protein [Planctomycetales bacterium]